jgi:hypothetical protein
MSPYKKREDRLANGARYRANRTPEQRAEQLENQKAWRKANPERARELARASREKLKARMLADPDHKNHGTLTGYSVGCRCFRCNTIRREYEQLRRNKKKDA